MKSTLERLLDESSSLEVANSIRTQGLEATCEHVETLIARGSTDPNLFRCLGVIQLMVGKASDAEASCREALNLNVRDHQNVLALGLCLHKLGKFRDAERHYRKALEDGSDVWVLWNELGRALNNLGNLLEARDAFEKATRLAPEEGEPWRNLGHIWRRLGNWRRAAEDFQRATDLSPDDGDALLGLATVQLVEGRLVFAETSLRKLLKFDSGNAQAATHLGICLYKQGRLTEACDTYRKSLDAVPDMPDTLVNYGISLHALGNYVDAASCFRRAASLGLRSPGVIARYAESLAASGDVAEAIKEIVDYVSQSLGEDVDTEELWHLAEVSRSLGSLDEAIECYRRSLRGSLNNAKLNFLLGATLAEKGDLNEALKIIDRALALRPTYQSAIACKVAILRRLGRKESARDLLDLQRDVLCRTLNAPGGYADLESFNKALVERVLAEPTLKYEREGNATRQGAHTGVLDTEKPGPLRDLVMMIEGVVRDYLEDLPFLSGHPLRGRCPARWKLQIWAVVMDRGGHQVAHAHDDGYLSGVYYPSVPNSVSGGGEAGCLELGRPADKLAGQEEHDVRLIRPEPGRLIVFPSYCVHRTIPLETSGTRISIAFDMVPKEWGSHKHDTSVNKISSTEEMVTFLRKVTAGQIQHSGDSLLEHFKGVRSVLRIWGERPEVYNAGLFHSVYGSESFKSGPVSADRRCEVTALIGKEAERLAWLFCTVRRYTLFDSVTKAEHGQRIQSREDGQWIDLNPKEFRDLITITVANWVEQAERRPSDRRLRPRPPLLAMRSYLSEEARAHFDRVCRRMHGLGG